MKGRAFGVKPRPRALLLVHDAAIAEAAAPHFPTARGIQSLDEVEQTEWDLIVSSIGVPSWAAGHLYVLAFGAQFLGRATEMVEPAASPHATVVARVGTSHSSELEVPPGLPPRVAQLVESDLLPQALQQDQHDAIVEAYRSGSPIGPSPSVFVPFLRTSVGDDLAGRFLREGGQAECWTLPPYADPGKWARVAIQEWSETDPARFPPAIDWRAAPAWRTPQEDRALSDLASLMKARGQALQDFDRQEEQAQRGFDTARFAADERERRLVTSQGDELVTAVAEALRDLGFDVQDMDEVFPAGQRREDLRITSQSHPGWEAIVEVRGYKGGAAVKDLMRLQRFAQLYESDKGSAPSAVWYVVNQFLGQDPTDRPAVLSSNEQEVAFFADEYKGVLVDTVHLFRHWLAVQRGEESMDDVRERLVGLQGRFA